MGAFMSLAWCSTAIPIGKPISRFSRPGKDILEFGAGHGVLGLTLAESGANVTLVDVAPKMVAQAKEKIAAKDAE